MAYMIEQLSHRAHILCANVSDLHAVPFIRSVRAGTYPCIDTLEHFLSVLPGASGNFDMWLHALYRPVLSTAHLRAEDGHTLIVHHCVHQSPSGPHLGSAAASTG